MRIAGGPLWKITGDYIYELHYGADTGETMINYVGGEQIVSGQPEPEPSGDHELPQACVGCSIDEAREAANKMLDKIQVSIWTDNTSYFHNDVILVEGKVSDVTSGSPVTITVTSPLNSIVTQDQLPTYSDGSFKTTLNTGGSMWKYDGTFTIKANCDSAEKSDVVTVELSGGVEYSPNYSSSESVISVQTDDNHYDEGDTIVISGNVSTVVDNTLVVLQLYTEGNMVDIAQLTVAQDGSYSRTILSEGALWKKSGEYDVRVSYGNEGIAETKFSYTPTSNSGETTALYEVDAGSNGTFDVEYTIKGGMVNDIVIDSNDFALVVQINSSDEGFIIVDLPREFIDAEKQNDTDDTFIVQIDGIEVAYSESESNSDSRILEIDFEQGDSDIKIMGTTLIGDDSNSSSPNVSLTNPRIINAFGSEIDTTVNVNQQIQVVADITNHNISNQDFIFHIVIEEIGYEEWVSGSLSNTQSLSPSLSWTPSESGNFTVEISIFDNILNKNKLTDSITLQIGVN